MFLYNKYIYLMLLRSVCNNKVWIGLMINWLYIDNLKGV